MSRFVAAKTSSVRRADVARILDLAMNAEPEHGGEGAFADIRSSVGHVTPGGGLAKAIMSDGGAQRAITIGQLIDSVVMPGVGVSFDGHDDLMIHFSNRVKRYKFALQLRATNALYAEVAAASDEAQSRAAWTLWKGRVDFLRAIQTLVGAGFKPQDVAVGTSPLLAFAKKAWEGLESSVPELVRPRVDLWDSRADAAAGIPAELRDRVARALDAAFGESGDRRAIAYHGFYYFTPMQWAFFQLLRAVGGIDQYFIVHDDGHSPAFDSWRHFFLPEFEMPSPAPVGGETREPEPMAEALRQGLLGQTVALDADSKHRLLIGSFDDLASFARFLATDEAAASEAEQQGAGRTAIPSLYAADHEVLDQHLRRLAPFKARSGTDLASLPAGVFILRLHDCIQPRNAAVRGHEVRLSTQIALDIAATGYFVIRHGGKAVNAADHLLAIERALPYFEGCRTCQEWRDRAASLEQLIKLAAPERQPEESATDRERVANAADNPLLRLPWCDLTPSECAAVTGYVDQLTRCLDDLIGSEERNVAEHLGDISARLKSAMEHIANEDERARVAGELEAAVSAITRDNSGNAPTDAIADLVNQLLGRESAIAPASADDGDDAGSSRPTDDESVVCQLRDLDVLGFEPTSTGVHIANLADGTFPRPVRVFGWPFNRACLAGGPEQSLRLLDIRCETAAAGDMYLLWLALDGCTGNSSVRLSWIRDVNREPRGHSALLNLFARIDMNAEWESAIHAIGGIEIERFDLPPAPTKAVAPRGAHRTDDASHAESHGLDRRAVAIANACPRRLAIQWLLGPTSAFQEAWFQTMAYGNLMNVLRAHQTLGARASAIGRLAWLPLSPGALESSERWSAIRPLLRGGARAEWLLTLSGSLEDESGLSHAYKAALPGAEPIALSVIVPAESSGRCIPPGQASAPPPADGARSDERTEICTFCPVKHRCLEFVRDERY